MKILFIVLLFASVSFGQSIQQKVNKFEKSKEYGVKYNKFRQDTTVEVDVKAGSLMLSFMLVMPDKGGEPSRLIFFSSERLLVEPVLRFLIDGKPFSIESDNIDKLVSFSVSSDLWDALSSAKTIEVQLSSKEGNLAASEVQKLKNLASLTRPQANPK